jgi:hypothetical protein
LAGKKQKRGDQLAKPPDWLKLKGMLRHRQLKYRKAGVGGRGL